MVLQNCKSKRQRNSTGLVQPLIALTLLRFAQSVKAILFRFSRRRRKFIAVNLLNLALLCMITTFGGWRVLLATIGFAVLMLSFVAFIGWLHDD